MNLPDRFWAKVDKTDTCWLWTGAVSGRGYGAFHEGAAHRLAWADANGPIPDGLVLDHLCRVRHCVNPAHLEPVTQLVNVRRGASCFGNPAPDASLIPADRELISATEAAGALGTSPRAVHRMIQRGELRATKMPGLRAPYLIDRADVEALLDRKTA